MLEEIVLGLWYVEKSAIFDIEQLLHLKLTNF